VDDHLEPLRHRGFGYDAAGLRARSTPPGIAWEETRHYLLPDGSPFYEDRTPGNSGVPIDARSFVFVGGRLLAVVGHVFDGERIVSEVAHVASDHIGFPVMTLDADGAETWQARDVLPFGEIAVATGDADLLLRYPGQWAMPGPSPGMTELLSNGYRWYRPGWGRYTQSDPIGPVVTKVFGSPCHSSRMFAPNALYPYAANNSLRFFDPLGLVAWSCNTIEVSVGGAFAGGLFFVECESECVNGKKVYGDYGIGGFGWGVGFAIPAELGAWDLEDGTSDPDAENLEGHFALHGFSVTPFFGFSWTRVEQGLGVGTWGGASSGGFGVSY
jgi:RHS repeat-associated protein